MIGKALTGARYEGCLIPLFSPKKSENSGFENDLETDSPKKPLARTNSGKRGKRNNESAKPEELLVDSAESLDLGPSELTWNTWEEKLDSEHKIQEKEKPTDEKSNAQQDKKPEEPKDRTEELMVAPENEPENESDRDEKMEVETPKTTEFQPVNEIQHVPVVEVEPEENESLKQAAAEPPGQSDIGKEFSDEDNELMIDENFVAGQEFLKFRNRSLDNETANGPISDISS